MRNDITTCIRALIKLKDAIQKKSKRLGNIEKAIIETECIDDTITYLEKSYTKFIDDIFVMPVKIGNTVYQKDGEWIVYGYDCDEMGKWRIKLKKNNHNKIGLAEHSKPYVTSLNKTFFTSAQKCKEYYDEEEKIIKR